MKLIQGGRVRSRKNRYGSCSSRVDIIDDANVADVDQIDIEAGDLSVSNDTIAAPDEVDDAGVFSIANDNTNEDENTLAEKKEDLLAVRTRRTATNQRSEKKNS